MSKLTPNFDNDAILVGGLNEGSDLSAITSSEALLTAEVNTTAQYIASLNPKNEVVVNLTSGARGRSAYELWLLEGNEGTVEDFFASLSGNVTGLYVHPDTHSANMIIETTDKQFITFEEKERLSGYIHDQIVSSKNWIINHTLDKFPSVSVIDTGGNLVIGEVEYISKSQIIISFSYEFSGKAFLN